MTPCGYDGSNFQYIGSRFYALDLWNCLNFADTSDRSAIDSHIYYPVERLSCSMSIPTR